MGEQGAESIPEYLNRLKIHYQGIANPLEKLKYIVMEHNMETTPGINCPRPAPRNTENGLGKNSFHLCICITVYPLSWDSSTSSYLL